MKPVVQNANGIKKGILKRRRLEDDPCEEDLNFESIDNRSLDNGT